MCTSYDLHVFAIQVMIFQDKVIMVRGSRTIIDL